MNKSKPINHWTDPSNLCFEDQFRTNQEGFSNQSKQINQSKADLKPIKRSVKTNQKKFKTE